MAAKQACDGNQKEEMGTVKVLIAYASRFGCTETCANQLKDKLKGAEFRVVDLGKESPGELEGYDAVVVGGPIYAGNIEASVKKFSTENVDILLQKKLALFLCCGNGDQFAAQLSSAFDPRLIEHAVAHEHFGYEFKLAEMGFFFRLIVRLVAKVKQSESRILDENITRLADKLAE